MTESRAKSAAPDVGLGVHALDVTKMCPREKFLKLPINFAGDEDGRRPDATEGSPSWAATNRKSICERIR